MITKINILIMNTATQKYIIDTINNTITKNGTTKKILPEIINDIIRMISVWDREYYSNKVIDGEEFYIEIVSDKITTIHGKGSYPSNYADFKTLLGALW